MLNKATVAKYLLIMAHNQGIKELFQLLVKRKIMNKEMQ